MAQILIVDDNAGTLAWMAAALEAGGHEVRVAASGRQGIHVLNDWRPDLVLTDILMPEMDGFAFGQIVKSKLAVPVMLISAVQAEAEAVIRGVDGFVRKPVAPATLRAEVSRLLEGSTARRTLLVVDDDADLRGMLHAALEPVADVVEAEHGREALGVLEQIPIALVISDVHMPVMDGQQLVREMRSNPRFRLVPVIVQTADRTAARSTVWRELGVSHAFSKDEFIDWLLARIADAVQNTRPTAA